MHTCPTCKTKFSPAANQNGLVKKFCSNKCRAMYHKLSRRTCILCGDQSSTVYSDVVALEDGEYSVCRTCASLPEAAKATASMDTLTKQAQKLAIETYALDTQLGALELNTAIGGAKAAAKYRSAIYTRKTGIDRVTAIDGFFNRERKMLQMRELLKANENTG